MGDVVKKPFADAFNDMMELYGVADFAFVGRKVDGEIDGFWVAGIGNDVIGDRERADVLYAEMNRLSVDMLVRTTPRNRSEAST